MGKRGPLPKSKIEKVMSGKLPMTKQNGLDGDYTNFEPPDAPKHLTVAEKKIWKDTVALLKPLRVIEKIDVAVLDAYCCSYVRWRDAERGIQAAKKKGYPASGLLAIGAQGGIIANPLVTISRQERSALVNYAQQLGMTPAVRKRVMLGVPPEQKKKNPFERLKNDRTRKLDTKGKKVRKVSNNQKK